MSYNYETAGCRSLFSPISSVPSPTRRHSRTRSPPPHHAAGPRLRRRQSTAATPACTRRSPVLPPSASAAHTPLQCRPRAARAFHDARATALRRPCRLRLFHATCTVTRRSTPPLHSAALRHLRHSRIAQPAPRILRHRHAASHRSCSANPAMHRSCSRRRDGS